MSETARTATARPATAAAWVVVLVVGGIAAIVVLTATFSARNTDASIDGRTATTSQFVDGS